MVSFWNYISYLGTEHKTAKSDIRNIVLTNRILVIVFLLNLVLFVTNLSISGWSFLTKVILIGDLGGLIVILTLNKVGLSQLARLILSMMFSFYPFYSSISDKIVDPEGVEEVMYFMPRLFIMITAVIPLMTFSFKEWKILTLALLASLIPLISFDAVHVYFNVGYYQMGFDATRYPIFTAISIISYLMFVLATFFFKRITEKYELENLALIHSLEKKNNELKSRKEEIESQALELTQANHEIKVMNEKLENTVDERTQKIIEQASKFQKFSFKNSHELRAPIAKVIGFINLLRTTENEKDRQQLHQHLEETCKELDAIVHEINNILNEALVEEN